MPWFFLQNDNYQYNIKQPTNVNKMKTLGKCNYFIKIGLTSTQYNFKLS